MAKENYYKKILENINNQVFVVDKHIDIVYANTPMVKKLKSALLPANFRQISLAVANVFKNGKEKELDLKVKVPSLKCHWRRIKFVLIKNNETKEQFVAIIVTSVDSFKSDELIIKEKIKNLKSEFNFSDAIVVIIGKDKKIKFIDDAGYKLLGYKKDSLIGKNWFDNFIPKKLINNIKKVFNKIISGEVKQLEHYENRVLTKDGTEKIIFWHNEVIKNNDDKIIATLSSGVDITESKKNNEELRKKEEYFHLIFDQAPSGMSLTGLDGKFLRVNKNLCKMLGYTEKELISKTFNDVTHPDDRQIGSEKRKKLLAGEIKETKFEKRYISKTGQIVWVIVEVILVFDKQGNPSYFITSMMDITERKRMEGELRRLEEKYSTLVEKGNDGIIIIQDGKLKFVNSQMEKMTGMQRGEVLGRNFIDFVTPKFKRIVFENYKSRLKGKKVSPNYEIEIVRKDGSNLPAEINASIIEYEGKVADMAIIRDISRIKELDKIKTEFVSIASHQLRTPVTGIKWFAELLLSGKKGSLNNDQKEYLEQIYASNDRMIILIDDLLSVSRIESGKKFVITPKKTNMKNFVVNIIDSYKIIAKNREIKVKHCKSCQNGFFLNIDSNKIHQVFDNLLSNAIKYSPEYSEIEIGCSHSSEGVIFSIKDKGYGIPNSQQNRVYDKFFRADNIVRKGTTGTGLGLYIARAIVEGHGGRLWFKSKENVGSTFYFSLPNNYKNNIKTENSKK